MPEPIPTSPNIENPLEQRKKFLLAENERLSKEKDELIKENEMIDRRLAKLQLIIDTKEEPAEPEVKEGTKEGAVVEEEKLIENPDKITDNKIEEIVEETLSSEEKKDVVIEMAEEKPLIFEPIEVKTGVGAYIRNKIVKLVSGLKMSEKSNWFTQKLLKKILLTGAVIALFSVSTKTGSGSQKENEKAIQEKTISIPTPKLESTVNVDMYTYSMLSQNARLIYLNACEKEKENYTIIDKPSATLFLIGKDGQMIKSFPVLLGQAKGEALNQANANSLTPGEYATTPAGKYNITPDIYSDKSDTLNYKGKIYWINPASGLAIHIVYQPELIKRMGMLNTPTTSDNKISWGCINVSEENWDKYFSPNYRNNMSLYITPDDQTLCLNPETGKLEQIKDVANYIAFTDKHKKTETDR